MRYTILLNNDNKTKDTEAQEQARFVKSILEALDIPIDWNPDEPFTIESKLKFRKSLNHHGIFLVDDMDGGLKIFANNELIGEWFKCKYKLKEDLSQKDPNRKLYLEMGVNCWSIFEKTE